MKQRPPEYVVSWDIPLVTGLLEEQGFRKVDVRTINEAKNGLRRNLKQALPEGTRFIFLDSQKLKDKITGALSHFKDSLVVSLDPIY